MNVCVVVANYFYKSIYSPCALQLNLSPSNEKIFVNRFCLMFGVIAKNWTAAALYNLRSCLSVYTKVALAQFALFIFMYTLFHKKMLLFYLSTIYLFFGPPNILKILSKLNICCQNAHFFRLFNAVSKLFSFSTFATSRIKTNSSSRFLPMLLSDFLVHRSQACSR